MPTHTLYVFSAANCPPCKVIKAKLPELLQPAPHIELQLIVHNPPAQLTPTDLDIMSRYQVRSFPTCVMVRTADLRVVGQTTGADIKGLTQLIQRTTV